MLKHQLGTLSHTASFQTLGQLRTGVNPGLDPRAAGECDQSFYISQRPGIFLYTEAGRDLDEELEQLMGELELPFLEGETSHPFIQSRVRLMDRDSPAKCIIKAFHCCMTGTGGTHTNLDGLAHHTDCT